MSDWPESYQGSLSTTGEESRPASMMIINQYVVDYDDTINEETVDKEVAEVNQKHHQRSRTEIASPIRTKNHFLSK